MPTIPVDFSRLVQSLNSKSDDPSVISTPLGLTLIEIQGDLILPSQKPLHLSTEEEKLFKQIEFPDLLTRENDSKETLDSVKFGSLELDLKTKSATLFISTTQRLIGKIEKIDPPLGILKINHNNDTNDTCEMVDLIQNKIIFKQRPLPIM